MTNKIIISTPKGFSWSGTNDDISKKVIFKFKARNKLGKLLKRKKTIEKNIPTKMRVTMIENNKPTIGKITISLKNK